MVSLPKPIIKWVHMELWGGAEGSVRGLVLPLFLREKELKQQQPTGGATLGGCVNLPLTEKGAGA